MSDMQTWDTASQDASIVDAPAPTPEIDPIAESTAQAPTLETETPRLASEESARESESQQLEAETESETVVEPEKADEDVQDDDPPEVRALPSGSASRKWARRQFHDAAPIRTFNDYEKPIAEFSEDLLKRSQSRYGELISDIADHHYDVVSQRLYGMSYEEVKQRLGNAHAQTDALTTQPNQRTDVLPNGVLTEEEINELPWEAQERVREFQATQAREKAELKASADALQKRLDALEGKFTSKEQAEQQKALEARTVEAKQMGQELYEKVWSVVDESVRDSGLEVSKDDPPRIADLKRAAQELIANNVESVFDEDEENRKLVSQVIQATARLERDNAFREEDNLKVRVRSAFEKVKASGKVKAILEQIESYNQKPQKKGIPPPPAPGAAAGITAKQPKTWDDAVSA